VINVSPLLLSPRTAASFSVIMSRSSWVCPQNLLPDLQGNCLADLDEMWQSGPSYSVSKNSHH